MIREISLNNEEVAKYIRENFVCLALDNCDTPNMTKFDLKWLQDRGGNASTAGATVFTAGGKILGGVPVVHDSPGWTKLELQKALAKFKPEESVVIEKDPERVPGPPEGGLALYVTWKVLDAHKLVASGVPLPDSKVYLTGVGADRLWVRKDEADALAKGVVPSSLWKRISSFHLGKVLPGGLELGQLQMTDGVLSGVLKSKQGDQAQASGFVETKSGKVTRFDLIVKGVSTQQPSHGLSACLQSVPKEMKVPVALGLMLADPADALSRTLPHGATRSTYLE